MSVPKVRTALIAAAAMLFMMAVVGIAQYLVSGKVNAGVMVAVSVPTGFMLGQSLAKGNKT